MLTIQKLIALLEEKHLLAFKHHLSDTGNALPLKLVEIIADHGENQPESDVLCEMVYESSDEKTKRKFFQLAHYTFRLTSFLARRYPFYLIHNISKIEECLRNGDSDIANSFSEKILDIAIKIEDYATQIWVLKFMINFSLMREKRKEAIRQQQLLNHALKTESLINEIHLYIHEHLNWKDKKTLTLSDTEKHKDYFSNYKNHDSIQIRVLCTYGHCFALSFLDDKKFYSEPVRDDLNLLNDELDKHSYVLFPFSDDVLINIDYLRLKHHMHLFCEEDVLKEATKLMRKWNDLRFWQNRIDTAQIVAVSFQASYYVTRYCICYQENYQDKIPHHVKENVKETLKVCERLIDQLKNEPEAHVRLINLHNIYCTLLLLEGKENLKKSISIIEGLLINYQQIPFQKLYDSLFGNLIIAYFSLNQHQEVADCYRRYEKLTAKRVKIEENDLTIKSFYYVSQWLQTKRDQYIEKLRNIITEVSKLPELNSTKQLIIELIDYHHIPVLEKN